MAQYSISACGRKTFLPRLIGALVVFSLGAITYPLHVLAAGPGESVAQASSKTDRNSSVAVAPASAAAPSPLAGGGGKITISAAKLAGIAVIDLDALIAEKSALGFAISSDDEFGKAIRQCAFLESANTRTLVVDKKYCLAGCSDITERIKVLLKDGKNQETEAPIWDGCGTFDQDSVVRTWEEAKTQASLIPQKEARLQAKVDSCNQAYNLAKAQGISEEDLSAMQARLQGEINSVHKQIVSEMTSTEKKLQNTISYASSVFASQNGLNYVFSNINTFSRCFDLTEPMSRYVSKLKMTASRTLEGPNPYKIAVIDKEALSSYDRSNIELVCESLRKQKQLKAVFYSQIAWCGATDITQEVLAAIRPR